MPKISRSAVVSHTPEQMFDLVNDFERYPEFLPWCGGARVVEATDDNYRRIVHTEGRYSAIFYNQEHADAAGTY